MPGGRCPLFNRETHILLLKEQTSAYIHCNIILVILADTERGTHILPDFLKEIAFHTQSKILAVAYQNFLEAV